MANRLIVVELTEIDPNDPGYTFAAPTYSPMTKHSNDVGNIAVGWVADANIAAIGDTMDVIIQSVAVAYP
jgi:hypothetical protein